MQARIWVLVFCISYPVSEKFTEPFCRFRSRNGASKYWVCEGLMRRKTPSSLELLFFWWRAELCRPCHGDCCRLGLGIGLYFFPPLARFFSLGKLGHSSTVWSVLSSLLLGSYSYFLPLGMVVIGKVVRFHCMLLWQNKVRDHKEWSFQLKWWLTL